MLHFHQTEPAPGSAYDTWREAGKSWRAASWATSPGAVLLAANAFASDAGDAKREIMKRAFMEGAGK